MASRGGETGEGPGTTAPAATFVFADLAGFTTLTEAHGDERAAEAVEDFCRHVDDLAGRFGGDQIKSIGDAVMLRFDDATGAIRFALALVHHEMRRPEHLAVRAGMHHGEAVRRGADWFGRAVNTAARLVDLAGPHEVLASEAVRAAAADISGLRFEDRGATKLRGVREPVRVWRLHCHDDHAVGLAFDPVCRMAVPLERGTLRSEHTPITYYFCSDECLRAFRRDPGLYVG